MQCDDNELCNYMSFDSSKFTQNCAMYSSNADNSDVLKANEFVDSATSLGTAPGPVGQLSPRVCPSYDDSSSCAAQPNALVLLHPTGKGYTKECQSRYSSVDESVSTLTVNTYSQCLDACDVSPRSS